MIQRVVRADFVPDKMVTRLGIEPRTYGLRVGWKAVGYGKSEGGQACFSYDLDRGYWVERSLTFWSVHKRSGEEWQMEWQIVDLPFCFWGAVRRPFFVGWAFGWRLVI